MRQKKFPPKSVSTLIVPIAKKNNDCFISDFLFNENVASVLANPHVNALEKEIITIMYDNALRVTELLQIKGTDILSNNQFIIRSLKGSNQRIGSVSTECTNFLSFKGQPYLIYGNFSRQNIYYMFKRLGLVFQAAGNERKAVTHSLRHLRIQELQAKVQDPVIIAQLIGHRNVNSTVHYLNHIIK